MVMNLDKCIGCHTCSVTCKNTWTNRPGAEYMWFNNVETRPGVGYPRRWEDQARWRGGWRLVGDRLVLDSGGPAARLVHIFHNPDMPVLDDYYEPWTYDYATLLTAPARRHQPVARPYSALTGEPWDAPRWGPDFDDDLAGGPEVGPLDPNVAQAEALGRHIAFEYAQTFMMYLPRICEHCLNPACVAACPSGAMYKRDEDGIVLVDQEACRGWRFCVSACPYKKVYFNWNTHKAEKCTFCYPRIEAGLPTVCAETCVGRIRYLGVVLYDADRVRQAAAVPDVRQLYPAQLSVFLDPHDPNVVAQARRDGISEPWIEAARRSPVWDLAMRWRVALPLHPEYRTLPMVWYVPPLSPILNHVPPEVEASWTGDDYLPVVDALRIPLEYLASLLTAGDVAVVRQVLLRLVAMRVHMRRRRFHQDAAGRLLEEAGLPPSELEAMAHLLGIAKYEERFVIPTAVRDSDPDLAYAQGACSLEAIAPPEGQVPLRTPAGGGRQP
jgi:nitrate reductase beta subunit